MAERKTEQVQQPAAQLEVSDLDSLLKKEFRPKTDQAKEAVEKAVRTLAEQALSQTTLISADVVQSIEAMIAQLDKTLTEQINLILHHEDFQKLEGAWRGLHYLVSNTETDEMLKIRVMNVSKKDLAKTVKRFKGVAWDQSPIFKSVYEAEYGVLGGEPYGCLVGDYYFDHGPGDVELLSGIARVSSAAHCPFIAGASPTVMQMGSWQELANPRDLTKLFGTPEYAAWKSLRMSEDARYIGLAMPRFLSRLPYGAKTDPVEAFDFEEDTGAADHTRYTWANAAYAMATNIMRSFKLYGWCSRIRGVESGGSVEGLPVHTFPTDDGGVDMKCPTEIAISDRREAELAKNGFMPLVHRKNTDVAAFIGAQSLQKPQEYDRSGRDRERQPRGAPAVHVRVLPVRALPEVHRARQDRVVQGARGRAPVAEQLDHELRGRRSGQLVGDDQGAEAAGRRRDPGPGRRGEPRVLLGEVLSAAALPARGVDGGAEPRLEAAVGQGWLVNSAAGPGRCWSSKERTYGAS